MERRRLSIWFPRLASDTALRRHPHEGPFALAARAGKAEHIHCLNLAAEARGLRRGMALADARAICPDLATRPADLLRERAMLVALCRWAGRYGPLVGRDGADGLIADITGVAHLFGGEAELRADLHDRLARAGFAVTSAIAGSRGGAHALARHGGGIIAEGMLAERLGPLPAAALRIDHDTASALQRLGLGRIGDLAALPRAPLARRFGRGLVLRLDQALGGQPEPVVPEPEPPRFAVRMTLPEPIGLQADVMAGLGRLLARLCDRLARHEMGARRLRLDLHRVDGGAVQVEIGLARPMRDAERIAALFRRGVEEVDAGFGIEAMRLAAIVTEPLVPAQVTARMAGHHAPAEDGMADLVSRLGNRLGFENVQRLAPAESLIPEKSFVVLAAACAREMISAQPASPPRPITIFPPEPATAAEGRPPARFRWRGRRFATLRASGPERITPEWWLDDPAWASGLRDYWRVETREGPRLWLYQTPQAPRSAGPPARNWFVQGEFA